MAESHVISALVSKHAELAGLIKHHEKELARLSDELAKAVPGGIKLLTLLCFYSVKVGVGNAIIHVVRAA